MTAVNAALEGIREEIRESNRAARVYFLWTLGIILGVLAPFLIGLIVTLLIKL